MFLCICLDGGDDDLDGGELAVDAEAEEHEEEGEWPEVGPGHLRQRVREHHKHQAGTVRHHVLGGGGGSALHRIKKIIETNVLITVSWVLMALDFIFFHCQRQISVNF